MALQTCEPNILAFVNVGISDRVHTHADTGSVDPHQSEQKFIFLFISLFWFLNIHERKTTIFVSNIGLIHIYTHTE